MSVQQKYSVVWLVSHFFMGVAVSWLIFVFVVGESQANKYEALIANTQTENILYREKLRFMEDELRAVRADNDRLLIWLQTKPDSIPYYEKQIEGLTRDNKDLTDKIAMFQKKVTPQGWTAISAEDKSKEDLYSHTSKLKVGESLDDGITGVAIALTDIKHDFTAEVTLRMPTGESKQIVGVKAGASWLFEVNAKKYRLGLRKVDWFSQSAEVEILQISIN